MFIPLAYNAGPMYTSYKVGAFRTLNLESIDVELSVYYYYPGFNCLDYYYIITIVNIYFIFIGSIAIFTIDTFLFFIVFQIIGHFQILKHNMENLPQPKQETVVNIPGGKRNVTLSWYDDDENKFINKLLVEMIQHHKYIVR